MTVATFIAKNALRNKRRAALTILSVAISCALLVTLLTLQRELTIPPESEAASLRVIVRNKVSLAQPLPAKQLSILERIPGIVAVSPFSFFGGNFREERAGSLPPFYWGPVRFQAIVGVGKAVGGTY